MGKLEYIVIEQSIVGNTSDGFGSYYGWNGLRYPTLDAAKAAGFESRESDDFNIAVLDGNRLTDFRWMDEPMNDPDAMKEIAKEHGFKLATHLGG